MVTTNPRINITVPSETAWLLHNKAQEQQMSLSKVTLALIQEALDRDEDLYFSKISDNILKKNKKWHTHKTAWQEQ